MRTLDEINDRIRNQTVVVETAPAFKTRAAEVGVKAAYKTVDVVTTGTFEPMESSGAILNLGHTDPPIKIRECYLNGVLAYAGFGAVDLYLGAGQAAVPSAPGESARPLEYGGGHVIADLIAGKAVQVQAQGQVTDCYPRATLKTTITRDTINQFYLFNPRNLYQNFIVGVNGGDRP
ncbi:MAG: hypothetical protein O2890_15825, partial [Cyanobacteria bacterium]|nr:hypothetical protein [Cyanobacteriota bacterium]